MQAVWEHSQQTGGALVLMLAVADYAQDDGDGAYPSIETLAKKARMTPRNVNLLLLQLVEAGELIIRHGAGPRRVNIYRLTLAGLGSPENFSPETFTDENIPSENIAPLKSFQGEKSGSVRVKNSVRGGEKSGSLRVKPASPKPSVDPSLNPLGDPSALPRARAAPNSPDISGTKRPPDPWWDSLVAGIGYIPQTSQERKRFGKAVAELKLCGAAAEDIPKRCDNYRHRWPAMELTPEALIKHWSTLDHGAAEKEAPLWKRVKVWD